MNRRAVLIGGVGVGVVGAASLWALSDAPPECGPELTRAHLDAGISLGTRYLVNAQNPGGDFVYQVDWQTGKPSAENNAVRQAGATWGLALIHLESRDPEVRAALDRSLDTWYSETRGAPERYWVAYRIDKGGQLGTVALVALAILERLRAPDGLDPAGLQRLTTWLGGLAAYIREARLPDGGFRDSYDPATGAQRGSANPYADGECVLLLTKMALHLGHADLAPIARAFAEEDYARNVTAPLAEEPDPDTTKGFYQWGSMTWFELANAGHDPERWGERLVDLAVWMVDVHHTLTRTRNTAYAYEGLVPACAWARDHGDTVRAEKLMCVVHQGIRKLCSWQLGHPLASTELNESQPKYHGGVQNAALEPALRIDVVQHQTHALMLARRHLFA